MKIDEFDEDIKENKPKEGLFETDLISGHENGLLFYTFDTLAENVPMLHQCVCVCCGPPYFHPHS